MEAKELPFREIVKAIERSYHWWKRGIPLTPTPAAIKDELRILVASDAMRKGWDESRIKKNKELEKQALDGDNEAIFELIKRDFRYLWWDYTISRIIKWQQTIKENKNKEEVEKSKKCLEKIGKAIIPTRKGPLPVMDIYDTVVLYDTLKMVFKQAKRRLKRKQLNWRKLYEEYSLALYTFYPNHKILVKKDNLIKELTGSHGGKGNMPSEIALNCCARELRISTETIRKNIKKKK